MVKRWTVIRQSGAAESLSGTEFDGPLSYSYLEVLDWAFRDKTLFSGELGGSYDAPNMLLADGKIVVHADLSELAKSYGEDKRAAFDRATLEVNKKHDRKFAFIKPIDRVWVSFAYCCSRSAKYCDCVEKNHGNIPMKRTDVGDDYLIVSETGE